MLMQRIIPLPNQVLCLQETWFENSELIDFGLYQIENYHLVTKNRYTNAHGGLACYIHRNWNYTVNPHTVDSLYWEELFIEITVTAGLSEQLTLSFYSIFICVVFVTFREVL